MQSVATEAIKSLENAVKDSELFDTSVLIKVARRIRHIRIGKHHQAFAVWGKKTDNAPDLESAFEVVTSQWADGELLIDSVTVQTSLLNYHDRSENIYTLARNAWISGLPTYRVIGKENTALRKSCSEAFTNELLKLDQFQMSVYVKIDGELRELELTSTLTAPHDNRGMFGAATRNLNIYLRDCPYSYTGVRHYTGDAEGAMAVIEYFIGDGELILETLNVNANNSMATSAEPIYKGTLDFLCACGGNPISDTECDGDARQRRTSEVSRALLSYLTTGNQGVKIFNDTAEPMKLSADLTKSALHNQKLNEIVLGSINFEGSDFSSCQLKKLQAERANLSDCNFEKADLSGSNFVTVVASRANFNQANLQKCKFHHTDLRCANFSGANVAGADFKSADLRGVDLSTCNATQAKSYAKATYDEQTVLPNGDFEPFMKQMDWKGEGPDPYKLILLQKQKSENQLDLDFDGFIALVNKEYDKARISKAIAMLKQSRFELFCEQNSSGVIGIVKSQTDADLTYACKLGVEGTFACCTQNLNPCGGLRGALCKHILVLVIGLAKAGELDPTEAAHRVIASKNQSPTLNKELMVSVFLNYQNALNGNFDWRPTETIPEDYYTF